MDTTIAPERIPEALRVIRLRLDLTNQEIAARFGVPESTLSRWAKGRHAPIPVYRRLIGELLTEALAAPVVTFAPKPARPAEEDTP